jgi:hypothetical protein
MFLLSKFMWRRVDEEPLVIVVLTRKNIGIGFSAFYENYYIDQGRDTGSKQQLTFMSVF